MKKTMRDHWYGDSWATGWFLLAWQTGRGKSVLLRKPVPKSAAGTD